MARSVSVARCVDHTFTAQVRGVAVPLCQEGGSSTFKIAAFFFLILFLIPWGSIPKEPVEVSAIFRERARRGGVRNFQGFSLFSPSLRGVSHIIISHLLPPPTGRRVVTQVENFNPPQSMEFNFPESDLFLQPPIQSDFLATS